jgi:nucleotide-binding universal stress UspA family protein
MTRVLAALDNSSAAQPVFDTADALARLLGSELEAVHVLDGEERIAHAVARRRGKSLSELEGPTVPALVAAASAEDVAMIVMGARATPGGARPAGSTAVAVATSVSPPTVLVPPDAPHPEQIERILVPLEGTVSTSLAPRHVVELIGGHGIDVIVLHVLDESSLPAFTDQPQYETEVWAREFLERYCPVGVEGVLLETRVGAREEVVPRAAQETGADLIALGWSRALAPGRAPVVRAVLERAHVPVLLFPLVVSGRRESSATLQSSPA